MVLLPVTGGIDRCRDVCSWSGRQPGHRPALPPGAFRQNGRWLYSPSNRSGPHGGMHQAARRRTSQTVAAMSSTDSASSQPPSIHWNGQNRLTGW